MHLVDGVVKGCLIAWPPNFSSFGRIKFENSDFMWQFLKAFKGHRFMFNGKVLFHSIDKHRGDGFIKKSFSCSEAPACMFG